MGTKVEGEQEARRCLALAEVNTPGWEATCTRMGETHEELPQNTIASSAKRLYVPGWSLLSISPADFGGRTDITLL